MRPIRSKWQWAGYNRPDLHGSNYTLFLPSLFCYALHASEFSTSGSARKFELTKFPMSIMFHPPLRTTSGGAILMMIIVFLHLWLECCSRFWLECCSRFWLEFCYISTFDFNLDLDKWVIIIFVFGFCIFGDFLYYTPERFYKSQPNGFVLSPIFAAQECVLLPQSNPLPFSIFFLIPSRTCRQILPSVSILVYALLDDQK